MSLNFDGTGVALVTPFNADNSVDYKALGKLIDHVIEGGVEYLVVLGTTGESATLNKEEKKNIYKYAVEANKSRVKMVAGLGGNDTAELLDTVAHFDYTGYDAILSVSPFYNKPNQEGIYMHYKLFSEACKLPVIIYNVPSRTGSNISLETTIRLSKLPNIKATKEASGNFEQCMNIIQHKPSEFKVISGDDAYTLPFMSIGMSGVISVIANAYPKQFSNMVRACMTGDYIAAKYYHYQLYELIKLVFADGSPSGVKVLLKELGICESNVRLPLAQVNKDVEAKLKEAHKNIV
jgi:4-hydroxy-tetrahydrodipicolinate synthase